MSDAGIALGLLARTRGDLQAWKENAEAWRKHSEEMKEYGDSWKDAALELEKIIIELGARLEAAITLIDNMVRAANGDERLRKLLAQNHEYRSSMLIATLRASRKEIEEMHKERLKVNPQACSKGYSIDLKYNPFITDINRRYNGSQLSKLWDGLHKSSSKDTQSELDKMHERLIALMSRFAAVGLLTDKLLKEINEGKTDDPESLAKNEKARAELINKISVRAMGPMSALSAKELMEQGDTTKADSAINEFTSIIAPVSPMPKVTRKSAARR